MKNSIHINRNFINKILLFIFLAAVASSIGNAQDTTYSEIWTAQENNKDLTARPTGTGVLAVEGGLAVDANALPTLMAPEMDTAARDGYTGRRKIIYNLDTEQYEYHNNTEWLPLGGAGGGGISLWATATDYEIDDVIIETNRIYIALTTHTSGTFATDLAGGDWMQVSRGIESPGTVTDECLARFDGTDGWAIQNSVVCISNTGAMTGLISAAISNVQISGNTISTTNSNGDLTLDMNGTGAVILTDLTASRPLKLDASKKIVSTQIDLASANDVTGISGITNGGTGLNALGSANQFPSVNAGATALEYKTIAGTANQVTATFGVGTLTLSLPQNIHTAATPTFAGLTLSGLTNTYCAYYGTGGLLSGDAGCTYNATTDLMTLGNIEVTSTTLPTKAVANIANASVPAASSHLGKCYYDTTLNNLLCSDGVNWNSQGIQPADSPWTSVTMVTSWVSNTTISAFSRRVGDTKEYLVTLSLTGAPTAATLSVDLPAGDVIDTAKLPTNFTDNDAHEFSFGTATIKDSGVNGFIGSIHYVDTNTVNAQVVVQSGATNIIVGTNVNATSPMTFASGDRVTMRFSVPIVGLTSGVGTYSIGSLGTVFSAKITNGGTVSAENADFINGNAAVASSVYTVTFTGSFFSVAPNCTATTTENGTTSHVELSSVSASQVVWKTSSTTTGIPADKSFNIFCQKTGADFSAASMITASLKDVMTVPGSPTGVQYHFSTAHFGNGGAGTYNTVCNTSPCIVQNDMGDVTTVTRAGTGDYTVNFARTYSALSCVFNVRSGNDPIANPVQAGSCASCNSVRLLTVTRSAGAADDVYATVMCDGY